MPARLIVNADDFGLTAGIDRAILELHVAGVVSSASLMATGPTYSQAAELARRHRSLGVGCHLLFVDGTPISHPQAIPTLLGGDDKTFRTSPFEFATDLLRNRIRPDELAREAQAQIQHLQRAGLDVTHVDTHKHLHVFPAVLDTIRFAAERCGIGSVRNPWEPRWAAGASKAPLIRRLQLATLAGTPFLSHFNATTQDARSRGQIPEGTLGIAATGQLDATILRTLLERLAGEPDGSTYELCCHPGHVDAALTASRTRLQHTRAVEYHALLQVLPEFTTSPDDSRNFSVPARLELIHYGNLGVPGLQRARGQYQPLTGYEKVL